MPRHVEELALSPPRYMISAVMATSVRGDEEMGDLVVERTRFEEVPQEACSVEGRADQDEDYDPAARHPLNFPSLFPLIPGMPLGGTYTSWQWRQRAS
jgi:hypothetical protein